MKKVLSLLVLLTGISMYAEGNLLENGSFENGNDGWEMSKAKVIKQTFGLSRPDKDENNHILQISPSSRKKSVISKKIIIKPGTQCLLVSFAARKGRTYKPYKAHWAFEIKTTIEKNGRKGRFQTYEWTPYVFSVKCFNESDKPKVVDLQIIVQKGSGSFYLDNLQVHEFSSESVDGSFRKEKSSAMEKDLQEMNDKLSKNLSDKEKYPFDKWSTEAIDVKKGKLKLINKSDTPLLVKIWSVFPRYSLEKLTLLPASDIVALKPDKHDKKKKKNLYIASNNGIQVGDFGRIYRVSDVCKYNDKMWEFIASDYYNPPKKPYRNIIKNGDFRSGLSQWKKDSIVTIKKDGKNKYLDLKYNKDSSYLLSQKISLSTKARALKISIRAKSTTIKEIKLRIVSENDFYSTKLPLSKAWKTRTWIYAPPADTKLMFYISLDKDARGFVSLDDIVIEEIL